MEKSSITRPDRHGVAVRREESSRANNAAFYSPRRSLLAISSRNFVRVTV